MDWCLGHTDCERSTKKGDSVVEKDNGCKGTHQGFKRTSGSESGDIKNTKYVKKMRGFG